MVDTMKNKRNHKKNIVNNDKGMFNSIIKFILVIFILPEVNENRLIQSGSYSITAKFKKSSSDSQKILNCGDYDFDNIFTYPKQIRINNENKENFLYNNYYDLTEELNIIEYFWEDVSITSCEGMFYRCENIIEIDFSYFKTSNVTSTRSMFNRCINLASLNLSNFDTSKVTSMKYMFLNCYSLISLDLSNFDTSQVSLMKDMFYNCYSLISLDLSNFNISKEVEIEGVFYKCKNLSYINFGNAEIKNATIISELNKASSPNLYILINNETLTYLNSLNVQFNFSYELYIPKIEESLNSTTLLVDYSTYDITNSENDFINNTFILNLFNSTNIEEIIYTTNFKEESISNNLEIINTTSTLLKDSTNHIINLESNLRINSNSITFLSNYSNINNKSELIQNIRDDLINGKFNLKSNENFYYEFEEENIIIEITNTEKEKNKEKNKTSIDLGNCEYRLKNEYNISNSSYLYIFKTDIKPIGYKIPIIDYEIYFPFNDNHITKLDLNFCKNEKIEVSIPVRIVEDLEKYNSSSDYYNDICSTPTSNSGTDISIKDRRDEYIDNNMTLCEDNCELNDYDYKTENAKCSCDIKINIPFLSDDMSINKNKLYKSFTDINNIVNLQLMKCCEIVLRIQSLKNNYGSHIISFIILLYLICFILFYAKYYLLLKTKIKKIIKDIINSTIKFNEIISINTKNLNNKNNNKNKKRNYNKINNSFLNEIRLNSKNKTAKNHKIKKYSKKGKKKNSKRKRNIIELKKTEITDNTKSKIISKNGNINKSNIYTDLELNFLSYQKALELDNRSYIQYYLSLLRINHIIIFCFFPQNDYNSQIIKIFLFFFFFSVHFTVNALFFNDDTMHKIYKDEGKFNFIYQIPQIIYSSIISGVINTMIKALALSSGDIIKLKNEKNVDKIKGEEKKVLNKLRIKFILFFILSFILLVSFWYYITCFCGVYINTKLHLIKDTIISFVFSFLYQFGIYLIPGLFRIPALKDKNKNCIYKLSKLLQMI